MKETEEEHPSYGVVSWSHQQGSSRKARLFQSELAHQDTVCLKISTAVLNRSLNRDWVFGKETIIEVLLTPAQFMEFITSPNTGGTPCTLLYIKGEGMVPQKETRQPRHKLFEKEMEEDLRELGVSLEKTIQFLEELASKPRVSKADIKRITGMVKSNHALIFDSMPFLKSQLDEHMQKVVSESKAEVETYISGRLQELGLGMVASSVPSLGFDAQLVAPEKEDNE
ncbi:MAG: hypothetical protein ACWGQW_02080 [bacterium]